MLTKSEEQIMELLWTQGEPLTSSEIIRNSVDKTWKDSYVHLLINSLMQKGVIEVSGFKKATKNYARTFKPSMSREDYLLWSLTKSKNFDKAKIAGMFKAFLAKTDDIMLLDELEKLVATRKTELM